MSTENNVNYTAFEDHKMLAHGSLDEVVLKIKRRLGKDANQQHNILIFSDHTGRIMDFNFQGSEADILRRLEVYTTPAQSKTEVGPGRPKLGVISREISLLPRHWEWLAGQNSGASATLRLLIETAMKKSAGGNETRLAQERTYKFMSALAGDLQGYEEALRALYKKDHGKFSELIQDWPSDIRKHSEKLAKPAFVN